MKTTILVIAGSSLLLMCLVLYFLGEMGSTPMFPDRESPELHYEVVSWRDGQAGFCDYSTHPGSYNWNLEWHDSDGERTILLEIGNIDSPSCEVVSDGSLVVSYRDTKDGADGDMMTIVKFASPSSKPVYSRK